MEPSLPTIRDEFTVVGPGRALYPHCIVMLAWIFGVDVGNVRKVQHSVDMDVFGIAHGIIVGRPAWLPPSADDDRFGCLGDDIWVGHDFIIGEITKDRLDKYRINFGDTNTDPVFVVASLGAVDDIERVDVCTADITPTGKECKRIALLNHTLDAFPERNNKIRVDTVRNNERATERYNDVFGLIHG